MDEADARRRVERQASEADRRAVADRVIVNDADEAALIAQVDECWEWLLGQAAGRASAGTDRPSD
jgi:dephospho-CoA kinase